MAERLLIIVPTRGRPQSIDPFMKAWRETADGVADLLFITDDDDPCTPAYTRALWEHRDAAMHEILPRRRFVGTLNYAARRYWDIYPALGFWGDDNRPRTPHWDSIFVQALRVTGVVYGDDLWQGKLLPTAACMTSDIARTLGYVAPPCLTHLCADCAWRDWGQGIKRLRFLPYVTIEHMHPIAGKAKSDATYEDCNSPERNAHDHGAYARYQAEVLSSDLEKLRALIRR